LPPRRSTTTVYRPVNVAGLPPALGVSVSEKVPHPVAMFRVCRWPAWEIETSVTLFADSNPSYVARIALSPRASGAPGNAAIASGA
jgi:hypothetical protein